MRDGRGAGLLQTPRSGDSRRYVAWVGVIVGWMRRMVIVLEDMFENLQVVIVLEMEEGRKELVDLTPSLFLYQSVAVSQLFTRSSILLPFA
jgi:hypothetical protein